MDAKEAIRAAKAHFLELFDGEAISNLGLEEVQFEHDSWKITLGYDRISRPPLSILANRVYKIVSLRDRDGTLVSVKNREIEKT